MISITYHKNLRIIGLGITYKNQPNDLIKTLLVNYVKWNFGVKTYLLHYGIEQNLLYKI